MTTIQIIIEDGTEDELKKILHDASFKAEIVEKDKPALLAEPETQYQRIKKVLDSARDKNLFKDITNPTEWQREIRKEWERDILKN